MKKIFYFDDDACLGAIYQIVLEKKESVPAKLRLYVKKLLKKYKYPPDMQKRATQTVLDQAEILCKD